jgi:DNA-binding GntR family transcriptional regulator
MQVAAAYEKDDLARQLQAKDELYARLCEGAQNPVIASMLRSIQARVQMLRGLSLRAPGRLAESLGELREVVAAIEQGNGELAGELAARHVRSAASTAFTMLVDEESKEENKQAQSA